MRPTFDRFEALALTGALEAFDSSMREVRASSALRHAMHSVDMYRFTGPCPPQVQRGSEIVTAKDVASNGDMLMEVRRTHSPASRDFKTHVAPS